MDNKISFYFEKIEGIAHTDDLDGLVELHTKSFERYGWKVVRLDESVARSHPLYSVFDNEDSVFGSSRNGWIYTRACYMRWLAYASAGHFFADFDVINYGFTFEDALDLRRLASGPTFLSGATAAGLFQGDEYNKLIIETFLKYAEQPVSIEDDVNDMTVLLDQRPDLFQIINTVDKRIARDYSCPGWEEASLVHYPFHYVRPPRIETVLAKRPPLIEHIPHEKEWPRHMSRGQVLNAILSLFQNPRYLQVGASTEKELLEIAAESRVAVNTTFPFDQSAHPQDGCKIHFVDSDHYFESLHREGDCFDVVYLDGTHTFEQTLRDFCNATSVLSEPGVIVIDDVVPSSYHASLSDGIKAGKVRGVLGTEDGMWMGDVFKLVFFIETFFQQYTFATVIENHGQLIVWRGTRGANDIVSRQVSAISQMGYEDVLLQPEAFKKMPFGLIFSQLRGRVRQRGASRPRAPGI